MDLTLVALGVFLFARVLDTMSLRQLSPEARAAVETALVRARLLSFGALVAALVAGVVAYLLTPDVPPHIVIFGVLLASLVAQGVIGGISLVRAGTEGRYTTVFIASRAVSALAIGVLLATA